MTEPTDIIKSTAPGVAALSICESLLLALSDLKLISPREVTGILEDAAGAHHENGTATASTELDREVVIVIDRIIAAGKTSFRP